MPSRVGGVTRHVLAAIDAAIDDWEVSDDAMRITHGETPIPAPQSTSIWDYFSEWYMQALTVAIDRALERSRDAR